MNSIVLFILPVDTEHELGDDGWVFYSKKLITDSVAQKVIKYFNISLKEEFIGIKKYQNEFTQVNIILNDDGKINELFIRTHIEKENLLKNLSILLSNEKVEIFDPRQ